MLNVTQIFIGGFVFCTGLYSCADGRIGIGILLIFLGLANYWIGKVTYKCK